jgi:LacI family transcriptional regulator
VRDVARHAGVSVATVSRVLAGGRVVAPATQAKVLQAVRELDYVVNAHARVLSGRPAPMIAIVATNVQSAFLLQVAAGVEEQAAESGRFCAIFATHGEERREAEAIKLMRELRAEAVILAGGVLDTPEYRERVGAYAQALGTRLVLLGRPALGAAALVVDYDNVGGAYAATSHLLSVGHRRIAALGCKEPFTNNELRLEGYRRALSDFGVELDPALTTSEHTTMDRPAGYLGVKRLLAAGVDFSAVFAINDVIATGAMAALREAGRDIPGDVSVVGFDNLPLAQELTPPLTTVHLPHEELGRAAVRMALDNPQPGSGRDHMMLGTHLVIRGSVQPLRQAA